MINHDYGAAGRNFYIRYLRDILTNVTLCTRNFDAALILKILSMNLKDQWRIVGICYSPILILRMIIYHRFLHAEACVCVRARACDKVFI